MRDFEDPAPHVAHRPWPLPRGPWMMTQRWNDLLFAHWRVPADRLRALLPPGLSLDTYDGSGWLTIAPFFIDKLRVRGTMAVPRLSAFPELNVRTYATVGGKPGVYFFSLDAGSFLAVMMARALYRLPYFRATMSIRRTDGDALEYHCHRAGSGGADFAATYQPTGQAYHAQPGSLEHFLVERYCLYAAGPAGSLFRAEIHHRPWPLQPARLEVRTNTMAAAAGVEIAGPPDLVSFSKRLDVVVWLPERLT